jgi:hypothetical protein
MAWTQPPRTWTDGELVTAAIMNTHVRDQLSVVPHFVAKSADESVTSSTAHQDDDHLFFAMEANATYLVELVLRVTSTSATPDITTRFSFPAGATFNIQMIHTTSSGTFFESRLHEGAHTADTEVLTTGTIISYRGVVACGGTAGDFRLQWAQQTSNANATTVKKGSHMLWAKVA